MGMFESEVAADNQMRAYEKPAKSLVTDGLAQAGEFAGVVAEIISTPFLGVVTGALRLPELIRSLGVPTVEENLDHLGAAVQMNISRVERKLESQGRGIDEITQRLESTEFRDALAAAVLQTQRTKQKTRLDKVALILANSVEANDLVIERIDDLLRAAVELKDQDVVLLRKIYQSQLSLLLQHAHVPRRAPHAWHQDIQGVWHGFVSGGGLNPQEHLRYRSSLSRLESLGLIQHVSNAGMYGVGLDPYALLEEGKLFCERIGEIAD